MSKAGKSPRQQEKVWLLPPVLVGAADLPNWENRTERNRWCREREERWWGVKDAPDGTLMFYYLDPLNNNKPTKVLADAMPRGSLSAIAGVAPKDMIGVHARLVAGRDLAKSTTWDAYS